MGTSLNTPVRTIRATPGIALNSLSNSQVIPIVTATTLIRQKAAQLGGMLGRATSGLLNISGSFGYIQNYEAGCIVVTDLDSSHVFEIHGDIYRKWNELGREQFALPITNEEGTPDGIGRFNHFTKGASIYWHPATGAHAVYGAIRNLWSGLGWETSALGYPVTDETNATDNVGRISYFQHGAIYFSVATGAFVMRDVLSWDAQIHFSDGTALGGNARVVMNKNGDVTFSGHLHDSGLDPYSFTIMGVVMTPSGIGYSIVYSGHTDGSSANGFGILGTPNTSNDWTVTVNNPAIRDNWAQVNIGICNFRITAQDNFGSYIQDTLGDMAKEAAKAIGVAVVTALIALI